MPAHVRRAAALPAARVAIDTGAGLHGRTTHYAVARVPGLDWVLLREFDDAELLAGVRRHLLVEEPILVALALAIEAFAPLAAERGARVVSTVPPGLHARVDSLALRQVLTNLLENAVKYGPRGQTVTVGASTDGRCVRVWVDDEGPGVPAGEREVVWEAFRRGRQAEASGAAGSGIGLAVVRELAVQYGGGVRVADAPAGGARFSIELPHVDASAA